MSSALHILNGDSTAYVFKDSGLDGDLLVWREVLSQGPLVEDISLSAFWEARSKWICGSFNETPDQYDEKVIKPLEKLNNIYDEVTLWFEFDLHCQVNMLGVLVMMLKHTDLSIPKTYLVCPNECIGVEDFRGMGQLTGGQLEGLYDNRSQLSDWDFALALQAWKLYVSSDDAALEKWINETTFWGSLHLLKPALQAHLKRVRVNANGLNYIEQSLLDIYNSGIKTKPAIYKAFWKTEKIYGMGDLEIDIYLKALAARQLITIKI
jgi:hypothetical protein